MVGFPDGLKHKTANKGSYGGRNQWTSRNPSESSDEGSQKMSWKGDL